MKRVDLIKAIESFGCHLTGKINLPLSKHFFGKG